jgi:predicted RNase H-like nuclease (RuvC/YqgF family)
MSLKVNDWKAVLDQPKNAGLKAFGGTGISEALRKLEAQETELHNHPTDENCRKLFTHLLELNRLADDTIKKHKKTFTTACAYLERVKTDVKQREGTLDDQRDQIHLRENAREDKRALKQLVEKTLNDVRRCRNMEELNALWPKFQQKFETDGKRIPNLEAVVARVKGFHKQPTPEKRIGLGEVMGDYVTVVQEVSNALI